MVNTYRGEIEAVFDGKAYTLCLTLGALAELETLFAEQDMLSLAMRFEKGQLKAQEAIWIIGAGLRGAGYDIADSEVAHMRLAPGEVGYITLVANLLTATFGTAEQETPSETYQPGNQL